MLALSTLLLLAAAARPSLALDTCTDSSKPIVITADTLLAIKGGNIVISKGALLSSSF